METPKIVNLLNDSDNELSKFATNKWLPMLSMVKTIETMVNVLLLKLKLKL